MTYGISDLSIIPVRSEPTEKSEMVSQILFGEHYEIIEHTDNWSKVKLAFDGYEGWIDTKMITNIGQELFNKLNKHFPVVANDTFNLVFQEADYSNKLIVPGSSFPFCDLDKKTFVLADKLYHYQGIVSSNGNKTEELRDSLIESALKYFNAPYLWGGRTPYGIDCSGLSQIVYKLNGICLPRDASEQVMEGEVLTFVEEALPGDLAFFDNEEGAITHVGIIWDRHKIIHASGKVRIDNVDHIGIFNVDTQQYSHKLRVIKRIIS